MADEESAGHRALRWRCRRGMRELDALLMRYMDSRYAAAGAVERAAFARFLSLPDPEILALLTGRAMSEDAAITALLERLVGERIP
jgi:antitoxin CptB